MKYTARYKNYNKISDEELLNRLLKNRGVDNPTELLNVDSNSLCPMNFNNLDKGYELLNKHMDKGSNIGIIIDSDMDGMSSSVFTYLWLKTNAPNCKLLPIVHLKKKAHGIDFEDFTKLKDVFELLIVPDAGSNDKEECEELVEQGKDIIILDHHEIDGGDFSNEHIALINCMDGVYANQDISGSGVCYKFFREYEKRYNANPISNYMLDIVALGIIGDSIDLRSLESRFLVNIGLEIMNGNHIEDSTNYFLECIIEKVKGRMGKPTIKGVGFNITPLINAAIRVGTYEEIYDVFRAFVGEKETRYYQPRRVLPKDKDGKTDKEKAKLIPKPDPIPETLQENMVRTLMSLKSKQDRELKKQVELINKDVINEEVLKEKIPMIDITNTLDKAFTGYVAGKLANIHKRPFVLLRGEGSTYGGSFRGYDRFPIDNTKEFLTSLGLFNFVAGHDNAGGFEINSNLIDEAKNKINEELKNVEVEDIWHCDYSIPFGRLRPNHILQVGQFEYLWGNNLDEPLFAITDIWVDTSNIKLVGEKENVLKIEANIGDYRIPFMVFNNAKKVYEELTNKGKVGLTKRVDKIGLNVVGYFKINNYEDVDYPQVEIVDFELLKRRQFEF